MCDALHLQILLRLICWQISDLGCFTSFVLMRIELAGQRLAAAHKSNHASRLKEQEDDNKQAIQKSIQVGTVDWPRTAYRQQVKMVDDQWQPEYECGSKN